ncbi:aspartate/glutamate racemase family protein [Symbiobacterium terraclitae]|uniref:aspartate/glutamate racemase family protein n=1 Tax=Symbiobacterium terraclitae TaxID=557451 RepID=UPI0035B52146
MSKTLALLHTTPVTVGAMSELAARELPGVRVINLLDDSLLKDVIAAGGVTAAVEARMRAYFEQARVAGADAVLCCCSSVGDVVDRARAEAPIPLLRIDEPMAVEAVQSGRRIGVIATVRTTLEPTVGLIRRKAQELGRAVDVEPVLVQGAFDALSAGDGAAHDRLVKEALIALLKRSDVVVLAQASIARVLAALEQPPAIPVLTSPLSGLKAAGAILAE